jgi:hypothetical protein
MELDKTNKNTIYLEIIVECMSDCECGKIVHTLYIHLLYFEYIIYSSASRNSKSRNGRKGQINDEGLAQ